MNKFSMYVLLILIYLGLSKSFSPSETHSAYLIDERVFSSFFNESPSEVILIDSFQTGFLIKTYFQKYKIFHGFKQPEIQVVRTSPEFWKKNIKNLGMSLFRRKSSTEEGSTTPMPPGGLYIGHPSFGNWEKNKDGEKYWKFFRAYRHFPSIFSWKDFIPDFEFYKKMQLHLQHEKAFNGSHNEFGEKGSITSQTFKNSFDKANLSNSINPKKHFEKLFKVPPWRKIEE